MDLANTTGPDTASHQQVGTPEAGKAPKGSPTLARHRVRDGVQRLILSGHYKPGQRLVQQELAQRFGVAQSVVRESLLELQLCGLVRAVDNLGMFVGELDAQTLLEAYQIREVFEGLGSRLCCEYGSRADQRELAELVERSHSRGRDGNLAEMNALDRQFHYRLVAISGNRLLAKLTESYRVLGMFVPANRDMQEVRDEHMAILAAIESNTPDEAERLARRHVQNAWQSISRQVADGNFVPRWVGEEEARVEG